LRQQPVSEKVLEILFIRCILYDFGLGRVSVFAPTSREEKIAGYDARIVGLSAFQEIYLQFKSPFYADRVNRFTVHTTEHQHKVLKNLKSNYAYYIVSAYPSLVQEIAKLFTKIKVRFNSRCFDFLWEA
jgi:hypothetical protein